MRRNDIPRFSVRLQQPIIDALKALAEARHTTPSEIVRALALDELERAGYTFATDQREKGGNKKPA